MALKTVEAAVKIAELTWSRNLPTPATMHMSGSCEMPTFSVGLAIVAKAVSQAEQANLAVSCCEQS